MSEPTSLVKQLSTEEKVSLLSGRDVWRTAEVERLGIGSVKVTDGPNGARGDSTTGATAVCLPAAIGLGASFDHDLVTEVGSLLGRETVRKGAQVLLAPTINMVRHPLGGRNFESFGEDPFLTAQLAVAYVNGVQSEGVAACGKHFVANDVEFARMTVSSEVDEGVLREIYLAPFEAVVEAGVWSLMGSYPMLNGVHCTENDWLLTTLLREEWGFDGLVMSDWGATHHRSRPVLAGLDLEMPGPASALGQHLLDAIAEGEVPEPVLDARAHRVLQLAERVGRLDGVEEEPEQSIDLDEDRQLARRAATEGMVLLGNNGTLPLDESAIGTLCLIGPNAATGAVIQGGGSAQVPAHRLVTPADGIVDALGAERVSLHQGCLAHRYLPILTTDEYEGGDRPIRIDEYDNTDFEGEPLHTRTSRSIAAFIQGARTPGVAAQRWTARLPIDVGGAHSFGVLAVGRSRVIVNGELVADNWSAPKPGDAFFQYASTEVVGQIDLEAGSVADVVVEWAYSEGRPLVGLRFGHLAPLDEDVMIEEAVVAAGSADAAVLVVGLNNEWETEGHDRSAYALPGRQNELISRVAAVNKSTVVVINAGGPIDVAEWIDDVAAVVVAWYPGQEFGHALADALLGRAEPGGRLPMTWPRRLADTPFELPIPEPGPPRPGALLPYSEGLLIGHRAYDRNNVTPLAPFGFGLGYTSFDVGEPTLDGGATSDVGASVRVTVPIVNTGDRPGKCVVQAYVSGSTDDVTRPVRTLAGFASIRPAPGETGQAVIEIPARAFARWDTEAGAWTEDAGRRELSVGLSSRDLAATVTIERHGGQAGA